MGLSKYVSSIALGLSLSACASQNPYVGREQRAEIQSLYAGKVVAIRVCDGIGNCTEWMGQDGLPYVLPGFKPAKEPHVNELPPPRLISKIRIVPQAASIPRKQEIPKIRPILEDNVSDEGSEECEGGVCKVPGLK